jgi:hypothetical protein
VEEDLAELDLDFSAGFLAAGSTTAASVNSGGCGVKFVSAALDSVLAADFAAGFRAGTASAGWLSWAALVGLAGDLDMGSTLLSANC